MSAVESEKGLSPDPEGQQKSIEITIRDQELINPENENELDPEIEAELRSYYHQSGTFPPKHLEGQSTNT